MIIAPGSTDVSAYFKLVNPTTGVPVTGATITDLDATYIRDRAAAVKADLTALVAVDSAHGDNKAIQVDATNAPGLYRVDWPDAAFAAGVGRVQLVVNGAAIDPAVIEVELVPWLTPITGATVLADLRSILGTVLTETVGGYLTAAFKKLFDVASPTLTAAGKDQTGDSYSVVTNATYGNSALNTDIDAILQDTGTTLDDLVDDLESRLTETRAGYLDNLAFVTSGSVTVTSPVNSDGTLLTLVRGDDYNATDGLELGFSSTSWPTLTSATIAFTVKRNGVTLISTAGSVITATGTTKHVHVELTAAQTGLLPVGVKSCQYDVQATLATSNRIVTLARGDVTVLEDYS